MTTKYYAAVQATRDNTLLTTTISESPAEAITLFCARNNRRLPDIYVDKVTGMTVGKNRFFGKPIRAHELSEDVCRDINDIHANYPKAEADKKLDALLGSLVYFPDMKMAGYPQDIEIAMKGAEDNYIDCGTPITRADPPQDQYTTAQSATRQPPDGRARDILIPTKNKEACREQLDPPECQRIVDIWADQLHADTLDCFIRAIKGEKTPANPARHSALNDTERYTAFTDDLARLAHTTLPAYKDGKHIATRLLKNFALPPQKEDPGQAPPPTKTLGPAATKICTANPALANAYQIDHTVTGNLLLCDRKTSKPIIKATHNRIRTLEQTPQSIQDTIELAAERRWTSIKVNGTKKYKADIWLAAALHVPPLAVEGYQPSEQDKETLAAYIEQREQANQITRADPPARPNDNAEPQPTPDTEDQDYDR